MKLFNWLLPLVTLAAAAHAGPPTAARAPAARLAIGDAAPELRVNWIKGGPLPAFPKGKTYVVEFWATWCGPCRAAMPHLSELASRYAGTVEFIGVDVYEKNPGRQSYAEMLGKVRAFVNDMGKTMDYHVAMDDPSEFMAKAWMKASGQQGIPATFLVKDGNVIWIGGPQALDKVLEEVQAGTYDMAKEAERVERETKESQKTVGPLLALNQQVTEAVEAGKYAEALAVLEAAWGKIDPLFKLPLHNLKFMVLLKLDPRQAMAYADETAKALPALKPVFASTIAAEAGLPKEAYQFAFQVYQGMAQEPDSLRPLLHHFMASVLARLKDFKGAMANEATALAQAKEALAEGRFKGRITSASVLEFQKALDTYQQEASALEAAAPEGGKR